MLTNLFRTTVFCVLCVFFGTFPAAAQTPSTIVVTSTADSGPGTLRQAILDANARSGLVTIAFNLPGPLPARIAPATALPATTAVAITIDGTTQPGYDGRPLVEIHGDGEIGIGLDLQGGCTVRGLVVNGFGRSGIRLTLGGNTVEGCYVGTDASGTTAVWNVTAGIEATGLDNRIVGNVISGNGTPALVGGGILLSGTPNVVIQGNTIGMDATRTHPLPNNSAGIRATSTFQALIGGLSPGDGNVIAYNGSTGVYLHSNFGVSVLGNAIYANQTAGLGNYNGQYGIHSDSGAGPYWPTITYVSAGDSTHVRGAVWFARSNLYQFGTVRFELFRNVDCSEEGFGQGKELVGVVEAERRTSQVVTFETDLPISLGPGETLTATMTAPDGSTSPFSNCAADTNGCELPFARNVSDRVSVRSGERATLTADVTGSDPVAVDWVRNDPSGPPVPVGSGRTLQTDAIRENTTYKYEATNACGSAIGYVGAVPCTGAPTIDTQPADSTVVRGTFGRAAVVIPFGTFAQFQWYEGRAGDTSHPLEAEAGILDAYIQTPADHTATYWCRLTNACGSTDSQAATITVVDPMSIDSATIVGSGAKAKLVVRGASLPSDVVVHINNASFVKAAKIRGGKKITQKGPLADGRTVDEAFPRGATTTVFFFSPSRGSTSFDVARPPPIRPMTTD